MEVLFKILDHGTSAILAVGVVYLWRAREANLTALLAAKGEVGAVVTAATSAMERQAEALEAMRATLERRRS